MRHVPGAGLARTAGGHRAHPRAPVTLSSVARQPWWRATKTLEQSKRSGILYAVAAALAWTVGHGDGSAFTWLLKITFTLVALYFLAAWYVRRSREEEAE